LITVKEHRYQSATERERAEDTVAITKAKYFVNPANGDKQAVVLYSDGSTEIWDADGSKRATAGGDRFDQYCQNMLNTGYQEDTSPDWQAPSDP
jgi:hypothetical protein